MSRLLMASTEDEMKSLIASGSTKDEETAKMSPKEDRMKILESYVGIVKLNKPLTLREIFELEEDNWLYRLILTS